MPLLVCSLLLGRCGCTSHLILMVEFRVRLSFYSHPESSALFGPPERHRHFADPPTLGHDRPRIDRRGRRNDRPNGVPVPELLDRHQLIQLTLELDSQVGSSGRRGTRGVRMPDGTIRPAAVT
ncbi:hypothetical protein IU450_32915 [Nocardia abscessus]|uniref:hypothetical protein n=1 Tax=Nocardia abscessus TaxID=120957 RepID=UPI0018957138|nr:hypothetical protein [Nocardia abscessus]MBF6340661.1 hypothetical protein [Nocardia abscessus]